MLGKTKGFVVFLLAASLCFVLPGAGQAWETQSAQRLYQDSFPCDTFPSKCPESVGFLLQLKNILGGEVIDIAIDQRIDIPDVPGWVCGELYVQAGGNLTVPIAGLDAELFYIRNPADTYYEHLATGFQVNNITVGGSARLVGKNCIGFIDFNIPLGANISIDSLAATSRSKVWLNTSTNKVFVTEAYSGAAIGGLDFDFGLGEMIEGLIWPFVYSFLRDAMLSLIEQDGLVLTLVGGIMNELYHIQPCGCMVLPSHGGHPPASHIVANMAVWLLPVGFVAFLRRRSGR